MEKEMKLYQFVTVAVAAAFLAGAPALAAGPDQKDKPGTGEQAKPAKPGKDKPGKPEQAKPAKPGKPDQAKPGKPEPGKPAKPDKPQQ